MNKGVIIIAEAGVNHNGDINLAKRLVDKAKEANVDYVKFQTFSADRLVSKSAKKAKYQLKNISTDEGDDQYSMLKKLELSHEDHVALIEYCKEKGIKFFSTAFDVEGLDYLNSLEFDIFKSPSGEITNYPYLNKLSEIGKPVILSTGMTNLIEIENALNVLIQGQLTIDDITVLHCNTQYPTPMYDVNLKAMNTIANEFKVKVGYSDHTLGIEVPIAAVALGAQVIEKHFTLSRDMEGPDHKASLEPEELKNMVEGIRNIELALSGDGQKQSSPSEQENISIARKSIHTATQVKKGDVFTEEMIVALRPGDGISPMKWNDVIGRTAARNLDEYAKLTDQDLV